MRSRRSLRTLAWSAALATAAVCSPGAGAAETDHAGTGLVDFAGYKDCIVLENGKTTVALGPHCGGRVLGYSLGGKNAIHLAAGQNGRTWEPGQPGLEPFGGRCDIGPERTIAKHPVLWMGRWKGEIVGPRKARMISQKDPATGVQLVRTFELDKNSSRLSFTQVITNVSKETKEYCHWGRTMAPGGGVVLVPLTKGSRFPAKYIMYGPRALIRYWPRDENVNIHGDLLVMTPSPRYPEIGVDSYAGWMAYLTKDNLLFVKRFPVYRDRIYDGVIPATVAVYYSRTFCEIEPIGPRETIAPGKSASFTEEWWLLEYDGPKDPLDYGALKKLAVDGTASP